MTFSWRGNTHFSLKKCLQLMNLNNCKENAYFLSFPQVVKGRVGLKRSGGAHIVKWTIGACIRILSPGSRAPPPRPPQKMSEGHILLRHPTCTLSTPILQCYALHLSFWLRTLKLDWYTWRDQLFQTIWQLLWQLESLFRPFDLGISQNKSYLWSANQDCPETTKPTQ